MAARIWKVAPRNFDATVADTDDLSTVRGAGLTLLQAPRLLSRHLAETLPNYREILCAASELVFATDPPPHPVEPVDPNPNKMPSKIAKKDGKVLATKIKEIAASAGSERSALIAAANDPALKPLVEALDEERVAGMIYESQRRLSRHKSSKDSEAQGDDAQAVEAVTKTIRDFLSQPLSVHGVEWPLDLFGFEIASESNISDAVALHARLESALNEAQLRHPTCPIPPPAGKYSCAYNPALPASGEKVKSAFASPSVRRRREAGRESKGVFYRNVLARGLVQLENGATGFDGASERISDGLDALDQLAGFANDFDDIAGDAEGLTLSPSAQGSLAVIAFDGNGFGKHVRNAMDMHGFDGLRAFSQSIEVMSATMLADIIRFIANHDAMKRDGLARFETLLWGADEFRFVMPGWAAWALAQKIHASLESWSHPLDGSPMTFGMGIAIAKRKTPIRDLSKAAYDLSEAAGTDKTASLTQVLVFEGVDRVHIAPQALRAAWLKSHEIDDNAFSIDRTALGVAPALLETLKGQVGLSALRDWTGRYAGKLGAKTEDLTKDFWDGFKEKAGRIASGDCDVQTILKDHKLVARQDEYPLLGFAHAAMLHDYLPEGI